MWMIMIVSSSAVAALLKSLVSKTKSPPMLRRVKAMVAVVMVRVVVEVAEVVAAVVAAVGDQEVVAVAVAR